MPAVKKTDGWMDWQATGWKGIKKSLEMEDHHGNKGGPGAMPWPFYKCRCVREVT